MWIMFDLGYGWNPKKLVAPDDVSDPIKVKELLGIIKCPQSAVILDDVRSLPVISDDGKILVGLESIEILLEIVQRGSRDARLEGKLNPSESENNFKANNKFVEENKKKILKLMHETEAES